MQGDAPIFGHPFCIWKGKFMTKMRLLSLLAAAAALSPISAYAQSVPTVSAEATRLDLSVTGHSTRVPDLATINAGVQSQATTAQAAISDNAGRMKQIIAALRAAGIEERDIQTSTINLNPQYDYRRENGEGPILTGYMANNQVLVRFRDIAKAGKIIDALVGVGANQINGPMLSIDDPEAALDEARIDAIEQGRKRAELYARALGKRVVRLAMVSEGGGMSRPPMPVAMNMRMMDQAEASSEILPGEQNVSVMLQMSFDVE